MAATHDILQDLALSRTSLDRDAHERRDPGVLAALLTDSATRVAEVRAGHLPVVGTELAAGVHYRAPHPGDLHHLAAYLGRDHLGRAYVAILSDEAVPDRPLAGDGRLAGHPGGEAEDRLAWHSLRRAGAALSDLDAGVFTAAVALANWHASHQRCSRCGAPTVPVQAGWVRRCERDGSEHYPRTDPAVIMSVVDPADRLLLGRAPTWPEGRFSVLAGFVEPGESFEQAVVREVAEEVGVAIEETRYLGNQPWPFPSSVMIGFEARTSEVELRLDPEELAEARWVTREEYAAELRHGRIKVPSGISIAKRIIEHWLGQRVEEIPQRSRGVTRRPDGP